MRFYAAIVYFFLYAPIALIVLFSFNAGRHAASFTCCSTAWYGRTFANTFLVEALTNSLIVAGTTAVLATLTGTMASIALQRVRGPLRVMFDALIYIAIIIPGIVIGIATLIALVTAFGVLNPMIEALWPAPDSVPRLTLGCGSVIAAHTLFTMALVVVIVRARIQGMDRTLIEASAELRGRCDRRQRQCCDGRGTRRRSRLDAQSPNHLNHDRHLTRREIFKHNRSVALAEWRQLAA